MATKKTTEEKAEKVKKEGKKTAKEEESKVKAEANDATAKEAKTEPPQEKEKKTGKKAATDKTAREKVSQEETAAEAEEEPKDDTPREASQVKAEKFEFQSEVKQLLNILVYSLYQHKEVFLRELISNAVDALNKIKFESLVNSDIEDKDLDLKIEISIDKDKSKLVVEDTGVGMTRKELVENIGTIAQK